MASNVAVVVAATVGNERAIKGVVEDIEADQRMRPMTSGPNL